jgi:hypothetical protein
MSLRLACNLFATKEGYTFLLEESNKPTIVDMILKGLEEEDAPTRTAAATLAFNTSIYLSKEDSDTMLALIRQIFSCGLLTIYLVHWSTT